jgi:hypothetical protein
MHDLRRPGYAESIRQALNDCTFNHKAKIRARLGVARMPRAGSQRPTPLTPLSFRPTPACRLFHHAWPPVSHLLPHHLHRHSTVALPRPCEMSRRPPHYLGTCLVPLPLSHLLREICGYRVSQVRQFSFTIAASVMFASWVYGSPSRLARVPLSLISCPLSEAILRASGGLGHACLTRRDVLCTHYDTA